MFPFAVWHVTLAVWRATLAYSTVILVSRTRMNTQLMLAGVRQEGVLSPLLFAIFIDSLVDKVRLTGVGCYISHVCVSIFLYADDILLIAPSVSALQILLSACEDELRTLDMQLNTKKVHMHSFWRTLHSCMFGFSFLLWRCD